MLRHKPRGGCFTAILAAIILTVIFLPSISSAADSNDSVRSRISTWWHTPAFSSGTISGALIYNRDTGGGALNNTYRNATFQQNSWTYNQMPTVIQSYLNKPFFSSGTLTGQVYNSNTGTVGGGYIYNPQGASLINNPVTRNIAFTETSWSRPNIASPVKIFFTGASPEFQANWKLANPGQDLPYAYKTPGDVGTITGIILPREKYINQWQSEHPGKEVPYLWKPYFDVGTISGIAYTSPKLAQDWRIRHNGKNPPYLWRPYFSSDLGLSVVAGTEHRDFGRTITGFLFNDQLHRNLTVEQVEGVIKLNATMKMLPQSEREKFIENHKAEYQEFANDIWDGVKEVQVGPYPVGPMQFVGFVKSRKNIGDDPDDVAYHVNAAKELNIKPLLFSTDNLKEIAKNRRDPNPDGRPLAVVLNPKDDWNDAFYSTSSIKNLLANGYKVVFFDNISNLAEAKKAFMQATEKESAQVLILRGHGSSNGIGFGINGQKRYEGLDLSNVTNIQYLFPRFTNGANVVLESCSTGEDREAGDNIANALHRQLPEVNVWAATDETMLKEIQFDKNHSLTNVAYNIIKRPGQHEGSFPTYDEMVYKIPSFDPTVMTDLFSKNEFYLNAANNIEGSQVGARH